MELSSQLGQYFVADCQTHTNTLCIDLLVVLFEFSKYLKHLPLVFFFDADACVLNCEQELRAFKFLGYLK